MKKILITGSQGQVGWELQRTLAPLGKIIALTHANLDLSNSEMICRVVRELKPELIVNAAAYTAVDQAEKEPDFAMAINGIAPGILASEAKNLGATFVHYSTDYVFDGTSTQPYCEEDQTHPLNSYGRSKLAGEQAIQTVGGNYLIFRTSWVYASRGKNFLLTMLRLAKERETLKIVNDQIGAPTWSRMIAEATALILAMKSPNWGIYNMVSDGYTSWYGFAKAIFKICEEKKTGGKFPELEPILSSDYPTPAKRPQNSRLSLDKLEQVFKITMPSWENALELCMGELFLH